MKGSKKVFKGTQNKKKIHTVNKKAPRLFLVNKRKSGSFCSVAQLLLLTFSDA